MHPAVCEEGVNLVPSLVAGDKSATATTLGQGRGSSLAISSVSSHVGSRGPRTPRRNKLAAWLGAWTSKRAGFKFNSQLLAFFRVTLRR